MPVCTRAILCAISAAIAANGLAFASQLTAPGNLSGIVKMENGPVVANVAVVAENERTGEQFEARTSDIGHYQFTNLPLGTYQLKIDLAPFTPLVATVDVTATRRDVHDFKLQIRTNEQIDVQTEAAAPPGLMVPDGSLGATFSHEAIESAPLANGRTIQSLETVVPGVTFTDSVGTLAQYTAIGQRRYANRLTIDGVSADLAVDVRNQGINNAGSGALPAFSTLGSTQTLVPLSAIDNIEVRTTSASPSYARTPGAQTAIVTRAGNARWSGDAFVDIRPAALAAASWFDNGTPRFDIGATTHDPRSWNSGISAGGPLGPNRVFSFMTWERQRVERPVTTTIRTPSTAMRQAATGALRAVLDAYPEPNGRDAADDIADFTHRFPAASTLGTLSVRIDANLGTRHRVFARMNDGRSNGDAVNAFQLPTAPFASTERTSTRTATIGTTSTWSSWTTDLRLNVTAHRGSIDAGPASYGGVRPLPLNILVPSSVGADTWARVNLLPGTAGFVASGRTGDASQQQVQVADTWTLQRQRHDLRFGFDYRRLAAAANPTRDHYTYWFNSTSLFLDGRVRFVNVDHFSSARARLTTWAAFAEDTFRLSERLSLSYGLRYGVKPAPASLSESQPLLLDVKALPELQALPTGVRLWETSRTDIAPRIAAAYQLNTTAGRETTVSAGWSLVFDELANPGATAFGTGYPYQWRRVLRPSTFPVPESALVVSPPASFSDADYAEAYAFPRRFRSPKTYAWHLGVDQALGRSDRLGIAYVGTAGRNLVYEYEYRADPNHPVHAYSNTATSDYHALLAQYTRRLSRGVQARVAYTWSHAIDVDSGEYPITPNPPPQQVTPADSRGSSDFDRRQVVHASASYAVPTPRLPRALNALLADWNLDITGTLVSGAPLSVTTLQNAGYGVYAFRPDVRPNTSVWLDDPASPGGRRLNRAAFAAAANGHGTLGRNSLHASALRQIDVSLGRSVRLGRHVTAKLRIEALNVFNVPNFGPPQSQLEVEPFGVPYRSYAESLGTGTLSGGGLAPSEQVGGSRSVRIGCRLSFN